MLEPITRNLGWILFVLALLVGLVVGAGDLRRFRWQRVWAISQVVWIEAWRRKIWLVTPLAFLGVVVVSQLQKPYDEQDAIRQTIKFCVFATGLVVAMTTIILACTNLPREIENRVIYTVATKPTTRLEIVLGKVVGFAKVSLTILLIMGTLAWAYLALREAGMRSYISERLNTVGAVPDTSRATLTYYRDAGLLYAKRQEEPDAVQVYARLPEEGNPRRYFSGSGEGSFLIPFDIEPANITPPPAADGVEPRPAPDGLLVVAHVGYVRRGAATQPAAGAGSAAAAAAAATMQSTTQSTTQTAGTTAPTTRPYYGPFVMSPEERQRVMSGVSGSTSDPVVGIDIVDANLETIVAAQPFGPVRQLALPNRNGISQVTALIPPTHSESLKGRIYVRVTGHSPDTDYYVDPVLQLKQAQEQAAAAGQPPPQQAEPVQMFLPVPQQQAMRKISQAVSAANRSQLAPAIFQGRSGSFGQQLRGGAENPPVAVYRFRAADVRPTDGRAPFEFRAGIERSGSDAPDDPGYGHPTRVSVRIKDRNSGQVSDETIIEPESNRVLYFTVPAEQLQGGEFDVLLRNLTPGDYLGVGPRSIVLITETQPFAWNLAKSMLILWLMSVLITTVAIFTSTFLSWPIAVVLTLVILLGHWGVQQLGDAIQPGIGAQVVTDFGLKDPAKSRAVQETVEKLSSFLTLLSTILPDISKFAAVEDIERGVSIPWVKMKDALLVTFGFGLPLVLLSYVFLKNKEVAP